MLNLEDLTRWMDGVQLGKGLIEDIEPIGGGTQNQVLRFRRGEWYVLRSGPRHPRPGSDETIRREVRILRALGDSTVPVPEVVAHEDDPAVLGATFYLMRPVVGYSIANGLDVLDQTPWAKHRLGFAMVDALAHLSRVDPLAVGLDDFGRPAGFLNRQVRRWSKQLVSYSEVASYPGPGLDLSPIETWLSCNQPSVSHAGVLHGDYHIGNVLFTGVGELAAIVDWELATLGDPLLDFAHMLVTWPSIDQEKGFARLVPGNRAHGFPTVDELIERYQSTTGANLEHLVWYRVLAAYRLGVLLEGTRARAYSGWAPSDVAQLLHESAVQLWSTAFEAISSSPPQSQPHRPGPWAKERPT